MAFKQQYKIETYWEPPLDRWVTLLSFWGMQKSFAHGAWAMLRGFYGGGKRYRLCTQEGVVLEEWNTGNPRPA